MRSDQKSVQALVFQIHTVTSKICSIDLVGYCRVFGDCLEVETAEKQQVITNGMFLNDVYPCLIQNRHCDELILCEGELTR